MSAPHSQKRRPANWQHKPIHTDQSECTFGKGRTHVSYALVGEVRYIDITRIQRCICGERKVTRVSRRPLDELD